MNLQERLRDGIECAPWVRKEVVKLEAELSAMKQRAEAAEARNKASQEQEPVLLITVANGNNKITWSEANQLPEGKWPIYAAPVIPPDVAMLQQELSNVEIELDAMNDNFQGMMEDRNKYKRENAELTRKLTEQGMLFDAVLAPRETSISKLREHFLAEAKSNAVPEELFDGIGIMNDMQECGTLDVTMESAKFVSDVLDSVVRLIRKRHAAPQPETDINQTHRFK